MPVTKIFVPYHELDNREAIVVDAIRSQGLVLSHWRGANIHPTLEADSSGAIVLNAIKNNFPGLEIPLVSATHFDIDGFVGVWSLFNPELALRHENLLKEVAHIGDFREYDPSRTDATEALKLVCWFNKIESEKFYRPFGATEEKEIIACVEKFEYFLKEFTGVLLHPDKHKKDWETEFNAVLSDVGQLNQSLSTIENFPGIGLQIISTIEPVSYYALFGQSNGFDIVLSCYSGNRYELEYKYTTWVDIARPSYPRISFHTLAEQLNAKEKSGFRWYFDKISDSGPILRLENSELSKAERFAHPTERKIFSSTIPPNELKQMVVTFFMQLYEKSEPKKNWVWKEIHALNEQFSISSEQFIDKQSY